MNPSNWLLPVVTICLFSHLNAQQPLQDKARKLYIAFNNAENEGRVDQLKDINQQAQAILQQDKKITSKQAGLLYTITGQISQDAGDYDKALSYLEKAYGLCSKEFGDTSEEALLAKKCLSWAYGYTGHTDLERQLSIEMLDYYLKDAKKNIIEITDLYHTIGMNYGTGGNRQDEQRYYRTAIKLVENYRTENEEQTQAKQYYLGLIYNSLSLSCYANNNYEAALSSARKSLYYRTIIMPGSEQLSTNWMIIGRSLYQTEGNADTALYYLDKAIAILEKKAANNTSMLGSGPWASYKGYKAEILVKANRLNEAIKETKATIAVIKKDNTVSPQSTVSLIHSYCSLTESYIQQNNAADALKTMEEIKRKLTVENDYNKLALIKMNTQYAVALSKNKQWDKATAAFASVIAETGSSINQLQKPSFDIPVTVPFEFLNVYVKAGNHLVENGLAVSNTALITSGITMLKNVAAALEQRKAWYFEAGIDEGIGTEDFGVYDDLLNALYNAKGRINETARLNDAFAAIESSKANLLKYSLLEENYLSGVLPSNINNKRNDLKTKVYEAIKRSNQTGDEAMQDTLAKAKETYMNYLTSLKKQYIPAAVTQQKMIAASDPLLVQHNGAIINYFLGTQFLYSFVRQKGRQFFIRSNLLPHFYQALSLIRENHDQHAVLQQPVADSLFTISQQLYNWLLGGINLSGELVIIPHKELSLISFEMLPIGNSSANANYIINRCPVRYELSASLMRLDKRNTQSLRDVSFFGGFAATYFDANNTTALVNQGSNGNSRGNGSRLQGTGQEVTNIATLVNGDAYNNVRPADFLQKAPNYRILHIATHAIADQGNNHQCNFLFERDSAGNAVVSDAEIAALPLHADLSVLSACNTGLGKLNNSEGMISLGRSFFLAGCPSVVMSLWTVNDESTATIMTAFYKHLQQGEAKAEALRNAKLDYIAQQTNLAKKDPYYWAGFIVVGNNEPVKHTASGTTIIIWILSIAAGVILLTALGIYWRKRSSKSFT